MEVRILGPLQVVLDSGQQIELGERQGRLLARLSLADGPVPFADLAAALTDAGQAPLGRRVLDLHLAALAGALGQHRVRIDATGVGLDLGPGELDVRDFEDEAAAALTAAAEGDRAAARSLIVSALSRWQGEVCGGMPIPGTLVAVERLVSLRGRAERALAGLSLPSAEGTESAGQPITLLLTDVVGSTAQWELAPAAMHSALERHDDMIIEIVGRHGGRCLKHRGEGDSTFSVFDAPLGAVLAAASVLQEMHDIPWPDGVEVKVRMSVYSGSAIERAGDYYGPTVNRAARLRGMARGGSALVAASTADLVRADLPPFLALDRVGLLSLRDIPEPEEAFELVDLRGGGGDHDEADSSTAGTRPGGSAGRRWAQLPVALRMSGTHFCGRHDELDQLLTSFRSARRGLGRGVFLGGDPGIGKTRLTAELARRVLLERGIVAFGRADPEQGLPYRSFVEAFSDLVASAPEPLLDRYVGAYGGELSRIVPVLARRVPWLPPPTTGDPGTERHRLFDAARGLLEHVAEDGPVVLVLDDLHDATAESIHLTRYLLDEAAKLPLLLVVTYRDAEVAPDSDAGRLLTHARRASHVTMRVLPGLGTAELSQLVGELLPQHGDRDEIANHLSEETGGNPLFTIELLRTLAAEPRPGTSGSLPASDTVRDVISRRVERLGPTAADALTMAAVIGREFELSLVARALGTDEDTVLASFERAVAAHLVVEGAAPGSFLFAHGLVPHVLEESLTATRLARAHLAAADAIEALWGTAGVTFIDAAARHLVAAGPLAGAARTVAAARRAGDQAMAKLAPEQAARNYADALARADSTDRERIELLILLGTAQRQAGQRAFRETLLDASRQAIAHGQHDLLLAAVLANNRGDRARTYFVDQERVAMLRAAIATGDGTDSPSMARALALLALEMSHDADWQARLACSDAALAMARRLGDGPTLCDVLRLRFEAIRLPDTVETRRAETDELVHTAQALGDPLQLAFGLLWRARVCLELGDVVGLDENVARSMEAAATIREPFLRWNLAAHGSYRAAMRGDLVTAESAALECYALARRDGQPDAAAVLASHLLVIHEAQGRLAEHVDDLRSAVAAVPGSGSLRAVLTFVLAEAGCTDEALTELDHVVATGGESIVRDLMWMTSMAYLARAAVRVGHVDAARLVHGALSPWADQVVWSGSSAHGPVALLVSGTARVLGDPDEALRHALAALATSRRMACPPWIVEALEAEALALAASGTSPARQEAALVEAGELAARHGITRFRHLYDRPPGRFRD